MKHSIRFSIAGLMGVVLLLAIGLAALRSPSPTWAGLIFYLVCGVFALGVVGFVCGGAAGQPWWLGFAVFGWGYLVLAFWCEFFLPTPPITSLLVAIKPHLIPAVPGGRPYHSDDYYREISHSLGGLVAAVLGGKLARSLFGNSAARSGGLEANRREAPLLPERRWGRLVIVGGAAVVLVTAGVLAGSKSAPGLWAGTMVLLTWGVLGLMAIAAFCGRGRRRAASLGATLFGAGYMLLVAGQPAAGPTNVRNEPWPRYATNRLLTSVRPWLPTVVSEFPAASDGVAFANARILRALDQTVPMRFPRETPLEDVLAYVVAATRSPDGHEISIYVDPVALQEAEKTPRSPVMIDLERVPLRTSLELTLRQLGLSYTVEGGVITVNGSYDPDAPACDDPFLVVGQSLLALLAAGVGSALGALTYDREPG